jgi:hypothetical protein
MEWRYGGIVLNRIGWVGMGWDFIPLAFSPSFIRKETFDILYFISIFSLCGSSNLHGEIHCDNWALILVVFETSNT